MNITVLGVGNPIMGDDGIGLELLARVKQAWASCGGSGSATIDFIDGGTAGMELVPVVQDANRLLILDAVAPGEGRNPGQAVQIDGDQVPRLLSTKLSPHQVSLLDVLTACRLLRTEPEVVTVVGVVAADVDLRLGLSELAASSLDAATKLATSVINDWVS